MKWPLALLFSALLLTGCYGQRYNFDPFLGSSRVVPPGTGQVVPPTVQPYYQGGPTPGITPVPSAESGYPQSSLRQSDRTSVSEIRASRGVVDLDLQVDTAWSRPKGPWVTDRRRMIAAGQTDEEERAVLQVSNEIRFSDAENERPAPLSQNGQPSLGKAANSSPASAQRNVTRAAHNVSADVPGRLVVPKDAVPISRTMSQNAAGGRRPAKYGYDTDYDWLRGRLEYLEGRQQWKLRYIPIDGDTDRFGGSVVIADISALADYKPGDFVAVEGTVDRSSANLRSFSPTYLVKHINPAATSR